MNKRLFVYGTLRSGLEHPEARWLSEHSELIGTATAKGRLFRIGWYPGLVEAGDETVTGELLLLDDPAHVLERLDIYEGVAEGEYVRKEAAINLDGKAISAWVYYYTGDTSDLRWIPSGDFLQDLNTHFD
ncbi:MAG: gamma-glutamylcyclotransferase family protein [Cyclobacteriaceae bacterium]